MAKFSLKDEIAFDPRRTFQLLLMAVAAIALFVGIFLWVRYGQYDYDSLPINRIKRLMNLGALPPGYHIARGEDLVTPRSLWIDHQGAAETARVLVFLIKADDPSAHNLKGYYSVHDPHDCREVNRLVKSNGRAVRVLQSSCVLYGHTMTEEEAVFAINDQYSVGLDENTTQKAFDPEAFQVVLHTIMQTPHDTKL